MAVLVPLFLKLKRLDGTNYSPELVDPENSTASKETREKLTFPHAPNHFDDLRPLEWNTTASHEDVQMKEETVFCSEVLRPYLGREWFGLMIGRKKS